MALRPFICVAPLRRFEAIQRALQNENMLKYLKGNAENLNIEIAQLLIYFQID